MELSLTKLFGGSRYLVQSIHAEKLQVGIFSQLRLQIQDNALTSLKLIFVMIEKLQIVLPLMKSLTKDKS